MLWEEAPAPDLLGSRGLPHFPRHKRWDLCFYLGGGAGGSQDKAQVGGGNGSVYPTIPKGLCWDFHHH